MTPLAELFRATAVTLLWLISWFGLVATFGGLEAPAAPPVEVAMDVDGDGTPDVVRITRGAEGYWADVWIGGELKSTTRILGDEDGLALHLAALDVNSDGRADLIMSWHSGGRGWSRVWLAEEDGFQPASQGAADLVFVSSIP